MSLILGIESSCDETAAALVTSDRRILAHKLAGQENAHRPFGGVVPEIAARAHVEILPSLVEDVLDEAGVGLDEVDAIAATAGPGLIGGALDSDARRPATSARRHYKRAISSPRVKILTDHQSSPASRTQMTNPTSIVVPTPR